MDHDATSVLLEAFDTLWDFDGPAGSEDRFRVLLERARTEHDGAYLGEVLTQLARAQGLQRKFDDARRSLAEAERALRRDDARGRVRLLLERGRVERFEQREERGRAAFLEAWEDARFADRARIARWSIARCLRSRGDVAEALDAQEALLAELDDLRETDGYVLEEIAECHLSLGRADDARPFFARAFAELSVDPAVRADEPERLERLESLGHG